MVVFSLEGVNAHDRRTTGVALVPAGAGVGVANCWLELETEAAWGLIGGLALGGRFHGRKRDWSLIGDCAGTGAALVPVSWLVVVRWCIGRQHKRLASRRRPKACVCRVAGWSEDRSSACCPNQTAEARKVFRLGFGSRRGRRPWDLCSELGNDSTGHGRPAAHPQQLMFGDGRNRAAKHT